MTRETRQTLETQVSRFLDEWHKFFIDWWWRQKYNVAFGSAKHREQSFIDMAVEYMEAKRIEKIRQRQAEEEDNELMVKDPDDREIKLSPKEIEDEFDKLDLTKFNNG